MSKKRWLALALAGAVSMSMFFGGCKTSKEKEKKSKGEDKKAEAMLDDFCAYLKNGKYEKMDKLIDGKSDGLTAMKGYEDSEAKDVYEAARKRLSYSIENVSTDEKDESGEATIVLSYFDVKDLKKKIDGDATVRDIAKAVDKAKDLDLEFEVDLVLDDDWMIDAGSVDQIAEELYSFLEDLDLKVTPTETTVKVKTLTEFSSDWYDGNYNRVEGYHQSTTFVQYSVMLWECCYGETVTFEYMNGSGDVMFSGTYYLDNGDDIIYCNWYPTNPLPKEYITCYVYDAAGNIISVGCIQIYADGEEIPVSDVYLYSVKMVDENSKAVPGYHVGDTFIAAAVEMGNYGQQVTLLYTFGYDDGHSVQILESSSVVTDGSSGLIIWNEIPDDLQPGRYELNITNINGEYLWYQNFYIVDADSDFPVDADTAELYDSWWTMDPECYYDEVYELSSDDTFVYFFFETYSYYNFMQFAYTVTDGEGNVLQDDTVFIINSDRVDPIRIDLSNAKSGPITITVKNPDGSSFVERSIEVK